MNALDQAWHIQQPFLARGRVVSFDVRKPYRKNARGPETVTRGTPMPGTLGTICLFLLGV